MLKELTSMAVQNILKRKFRSFLTLLGVVIGVAAVVAIISMTLGLQETILGQLTKFMADIVTIMPGQMRFTAGPSLATGKVITLTTTDEKEISKIDGVKLTTGIVGTEVNVEFNDETGKLNVYGVKDVKAWTEIESGAVGLEDGRFLSSEDTYSTIIGYSVAHDIFSEDIELRKNIKINGVDFKVVGILNKAGGVLSTMDQRIYIPIEQARELFGEQFEENEYSAIMVKIKDGYDVEKVSNEINDKLLNIHHQTEDTKTFTVLSSKFFQEQIGTILASMTTFLTAIASISLLVGGIGIMNIMYVSVTERTREIGVMKAVGATSRTILLLFLLESGIFGLVGGVIGDLFGIIIGYGMNYVANIARAEAIGSQMIVTNFTITPEVLLLGAGFGFLVGIIAGFFPARRASKLEPVEALRYE